MKTSPEGIKFITKHEGVVLKVYKDAVGYPTIGVGHLIKTGEKFTTITLQQAYDLLAKDLARFEAGILSQISVSLNQHQFDSLVSFAFNVGLGNLAKSTLKRRLNAGDYNVSNEFLKWNKAGGRVLKGLVNRRNAEKKLWETGSYK